jgi:branched-chain amino acid aminotransferase
VTAVSIDGELVAPEAARISVFDRGLLYGDGCFEVLRTWDGIARELDAHVDRLLETAAHLELAAPERARIVEAVYRTIVAAQVEGGPDDSPVERRIRIILTRGPGSLAQRFAELGFGHTIVIVESLPPQPVELSLAVVDWPVPRRDGRGHKTLAYLDHLYARELARAAGADEAIRLDEAGHVIEGATCNVFVVAGGAVATPTCDAGALPGIVRHRVLALCAAEQLVASERASLTPRDLHRADEVFVTSSLRGVVPVTRIDGVARASGPVARRLALAYFHAMRGEVR